MIARLPSFGRLIMKLCGYASSQRPGVRLAIACKVIQQMTCSIVSNTVTRMPPFAPRFAAILANQAISSSTQAIHRNHRTACRLSTEQEVR
jgi:hypothetical protein